MAYTATAINVMIASPSDVATERNIVRSVVHEWNAIHSRDRNLVLAPVGWDTHSHPVIGDRPQAIINKQLLDDADLLIAVFWTRLGTPTGDAVSGTAEEIEGHVRSGKPAMIYFSQAPVRLDSVDQRQYAALREFRDSLRERGLIETYATVEDFRQKLSRQLAQKVIEVYGGLPGFGTSDSVIATVRPPPTLGEAAKFLLAEMAQDRNGSLLIVATFGGLVVQTNGKQLSNKDARSEARFKAAVKELVDLSLIQPRGANNEVFAITHSGYAVADELGVNTAIR